MLTMKKLVVPLLACALLLCGCARHWVMKLNNGIQITTVGKPKLKGNSYYYKDATGKVREVSQGRVAEIEPQSMAKREKGQFIPATAK